MKGILTYDHETERIAIKNHADLLPLQCGQPLKVQFEIGGLEHLTRVKSGAKQSVIVISSSRFFRLQAGMGLTGSTPQKPLHLKQGNEG